MERTPSGTRQQRQWAMAWSPEQIAGRQPLDFPDDDSMRISHDAIYQALYVQGRGALRRELTASSAPAAHSACREPESAARENLSFLPRL
jgi:IS30 family transposase